MIDSLLDFIAPYPCFGCGKLGRPLCINCKYNIVSEPYVACIVCERPCGKNGICTTCHVPYSRAWCVGERAEILQKIIDAYKFERAQTLHRDLADLLLATLPQLPPETVIIPVPTINSHIRQRGYDHTDLIAGYIAKKQKLRLSHELKRKTSATQRGASRRLRIFQAKEAFEIALPITHDHPFLLIDDIVTTGATLAYATHTLKESGARDVWVAVLARQISTE